ncbi:hypothetical protein D3C71_1582650 [compost metagenome]
MDGNPEIQIPSINRTTRNTGNEWINAEIMVRIEVKISEKLINFFLSHAPDNAEIRISPIAKPIVAKDTDRPASAGVM